jgi:dinuclear metal center YbgI/SA1388 family protein
MKISEITSELELFAPLSYQEDYDNSGFITGNGEKECTGVLFALDCTEEVVNEAISHNCNLVIAHHPIIFSGLKKITGATYVQRTVIKAIKNDVTIYACHTNADHVDQGVNKKIADRIGLEDTSILAPRARLLKKLVTFVPATHREKVMQALFEAGAGKIGNYDSCSFTAEGEGSFRGDTATKPFLGEPGKLSRERECRIETILPAFAEKKVVSALKSAHPYEEVAYDIYELTNSHQLVGSGMSGHLKEAVSETDFMKLIKERFNLKVIRHTPLTGKKVQKIAVCGGSGSFLLKNAIAAGCDVFITADFKYHEFFDAEGRLLLLDIGHHESEQFTPQIFYDLIKKKFPTFAIRLSKINTNPINYF